MPGKKLKITVETGVKSWKGSNRKKVYKKKTKLIWKNVEQYEEMEENLKKMIERWQILSKETTLIVQKNLLYRKGIGIQNFSGPNSYSFKRNRNYSFTLIPLKGKEYQHLPEL